MRKAKNMEKKRFNIPYMIAAPVLALLSGFGYYFALRDGFDFEIGHFDATVWFYIFAGCIALAAVAALIAAITVRGNGVGVSGRPSLGSSCARSAGAAAALFIFVMFIIELFVLREPVTTLEKIAGLLTLFIAAALICSAAPKHGSGEMTAVMFILAALAVNFNIFASYFDFSVPVNSPVRHVMTILQCAVLLFMIAEARLFLPKESGRSTAVFAAFVYTFTASVCFGIPVAAIVFRLTAKNPADPNLAPVWLILFAAVAAASFVRLAELPGSLYPLPEKDKKQN